MRSLRRVLNDLGVFVGGPAETATGKDFEGWLGAQASAGLHPNTIRKHGNLVRPFFKWARREGLIPGDRLIDLQEVPNPRGSSGDSTPKPYKRREIAQMWRELDAAYPLAPKFVKRYAAGKSRYPRIATHAMFLQSSTVIHLCLHAGLRREEVFRLDVDDLHPDNAYIVVVGAAKTRDGKPKVREVPMTADLRRALIAWLEVRAILAPGHERPWLVLDPRASANANFPSHPFNPMQWDRFQRLLTRLGSGWEFHRLRHTYATEMLRAGLPLENLKELLGHSRLQQTLAYTKIVPQDNERHVLRAESAFSRVLSRQAA